MRENLPSLIVALSLGVVGTLVAGFASSVYQTNSPFLHWAIEAILKPGNRLTFYALVYTHDFIVNAILYSPMVYALIKMPRLGKWSHMALALLAVFLISYWGVAGGYGRYIAIVGFSQFALLIFIQFAPIVLLFSLFKYRFGRHAF